jgi:hypothetical protein
MFRVLTAPPIWEAGKWLLYAGFILVPGSLAVLAMVWLFRARAVRTLFLPRIAAEQYLAEATDLPDLERRLRVLERVSVGPAFVTFNH